MTNQAQPTLQEALIHKTRVIEIGGAKYEVKPLVLRQFFQLTAFSAGLQKDVKERIAASVDSGIPDAMAIVMAGEDEDSAKLLSILLRAQTPEDLERFKSCTIEEVSDLVLALTEVNDLDRVVGNFLKAAEKVKGLIPTGPSLLSSQK